MFLSFRGGGDISEAAPRQLGHRTVREIRRPAEGITSAGTPAPVGGPSRRSSATRSWSRWRCCRPCWASPPSGGGSVIPALTYDICSRTHRWHLATTTARRDRPDVERAGREDGQRLGMEQPNRCNRRIPSPTCSSTLETLVRARRSYRVGAENVSPCSGGTSGDGARSCDACS
jgi:hypothetical protein